MPDLTSIFGNSRGSRELAMYPEERIYNAAGLLEEGERPTVPVRMRQNDWKKRPTNAWVDNLNPSEINLSTTSPIYQNRDLPRLAATLGHEQIHIGGQPEERDAYEREASILRRTGKNRKRLGDIDTILSGSYPLVKVK